jgi:hypothetical protein
MPPNLHILTQEQMLRKFIDEQWEQKLAMFTPSESHHGENKIVRMWHEGTITMGCIRIRQYSPSNVKTIVCLLRDGDDLYSYDECYFSL